MENLFIFINIFLDVFPFIFLQYLPFRDKLRLSYAKTLTICSIVMFVQFLGFVWLSSQPFHTADILLLYRIGSLIILFALTLMFVQDHFAKVYFIFGLMTPYVITVITTASYFSFIFRDPKSPVYMFTSLLRIIIIAITFPFIYLLAKKHLLSAMKIGDEKMWRYAFPIPIMFSLISIFFVDSQYEFFGVSLMALFGMLFVLFGCIFTCYFLLKALRQVQETTKLVERKKQIHQILAMQGEQYALIEKNITDTKAARHDLRYHLAVIKELTAQTPNIKLNSYIDNYIKSLPMDTELVLCKNYVVNSIASYYIRLAKEHDIEVSFFFEIPNSITVSDTHLCVIVGNTMENAIEACMRMETSKRFIRVAAKIIENNFSYTCDNNFDGIVQKSGDEIFSRKREYKENGIGLSSVEAVVKKYNGIMKVEYVKDTFMVSVLLGL